MWLLRVRYTRYCICDRIWENPPYVICTRFVQCAFLVQSCDFVISCETTLLLTVPVVYGGSLWVTKGLSCYWQFRKVLDDGADLREVQLNTRGKYHYMPEQRAQIGAYAVENGHTRAAKHFSQLWKRQVPEPTASKLKAQYLQEARKL